MQRSEDEWEDAFGGPVEGPDGTIRGQSTADRSVVLDEDPARVWSVIEGEYGNLYLLPGFHAVNNIGFVVAEKARTPEQEASGDWAEVLWFDSKDLDLGP